ncbi:MAG: cytochrome c family protein [Desulfobacula sp.]|nr:cytochrome c family protein [Desulfobacula sp.]MCK5162123.1 cytochrome c3 family protein [Desulfobacula sp.]
MNNRIVWFCLILLLLSTALVFAQNQGKEEMTLYGGKMGDITFPHHMHQGVINDCMVCHADFSKESGALLASKKAGMLKNKQVMNKTCLKCHRDSKKAGETYGPVKCSGCHIK